GPGAQTARCLEEPEWPSGPCVRHPARRAARPGDEVERGADADPDRGADARTHPMEPELLLGRAERDEQEVRSRPPDTLDQRYVPRWIRLEGNHRSVAAHDGHPELPRP